MQTHACVYFCVSSDSSPYFAYILVTGIPLLPGYILLHEEQDYVLKMVVINILNIDTYLPDIWRQNLEDYNVNCIVEPPLLMNTTKSINSNFGFELTIPGFTLSNKIDLT